MATSTHKSATSVTLAPLAEKSPFERFVQKYWVLGAGVFLVIAGWIVYSNQRARQQKAARDASWEKVGSATTLEGFPRVPTAEPEKLDALAGELRGTDAGPWVLWMRANALAAERDYAGAQAALQQLRAEYPSHSLVTSTWSVGGHATTLADALASGLTTRAAWEAANGHLFANPPVPSDAPRVRLKTDRGDIVLALCSAKAPEHVKAFLELADAGFYNGSKFHRIDPEMGIDGGDPNTISGVPESWGQGGRDRLVARESAGLYHFEGAVSAMADASKSKSVVGQFSILVKPRHDLDGTRDVFAVVESGLDVARAIAEGSQSAEIPGRPEAPVTLISVARE